MKDMKDSGIDWLGEIPVSWKTVRGKYVFEQKFNKGNSNELVLLSPTQNYGVIPQEKYEKLTGFSAVKLDEKTDLNSLKTVHKGAFVISLRSFQGGFEYSKYEGVVSPAYQVFYPIIPICDGYYKYLFKTKVFVDKMNSYAMSLRDGKNIAFADFGRTYIPVPPFAEQIAIAQSLDSQVSAIDTLTANIQSEIETLEAYKRSVITEAVTKGLDPDVPMKDSGIEWATCIPSHWHVMQNKYIMKKIKSICPVYRGEDILSLTMNGVIVRDLDAGGKMPASFDGYQRLTPGNLLMCLFDYDVTPRCIGIIRNEGLTSPAYSQFEMKNGNNTDYYYYYYLMLDFTKELLHLAKNLRHSFTEEQLGMINVPVPPIHEQESIADFLNEKCKTIDSVIQQKQKQLTVLADYKKSVIYEYVTGKKEVLTS